MTTTVHQRDVIRALRHFRNDREEFIGSCSNKFWRIFATTPHFYLHWVMANVKVEVASAMAEYVLKKDRRGRWFDVADTIRDVYINPEKWVVSDEWSLKNMLETHGQPE